MASGLLKLGIDRSGCGFDQSIYHVLLNRPGKMETLWAPVSYRGQSQGVVRSFSLIDGQEIYATRLEGMSLSSSPVVTPDGMIYFASAGKSYVIRAGSKYEIVSINELQDPCSASPAVGPGVLILKGQQHLFCVGAKR